MHKVIIVDDESTVLNGLVSFIDWESCGFAIEQCCRSGNEAWDLCRRLEPDLIITDIRMSDGDGLELIDNIRSSSLKTEIIILTGYEDFHVAKSALENGVLSILLKPIDKDELYRALNKADEKLRRNNSMLHMLKTHTSYNHAMLLHTLLNEHSLNDDTLSALLEKHRVVLPKERYAAALLHINPPNTSADKTPQFTVIDIINNIAQASENFILIDTLSGRNIPVLIYEYPKSGVVGILSILNEIIDNLSAAVETDVTIGISRLFKNISSITDAFEQARKALARQTELGANRIISYSENTRLNPGTVITLSQSEIEQFCRAIKRLDCKEAVSIIEEYFARVSECSNPDIDDVRNSILELSIFTLRENFNPEALKEAFGRTVSPAAELAQFQFIIDIKEWICELTATLTSHPEVFLPQGYSKPVQAAIIYTMKNYSEALTSSYIARQLYMSPNYFMRIFKKEVGKTYNNYLTEYRINIAKKLIASGNYKIYEISNMVGYPDTQYFNKVFKKHTGHTPNYYNKGVEE